jgi:hypothetical protein
VSDLEETREVEGLRKSHRSRSPVSISVAISLLGVVLGWGVTWGVYSQRLQNLEDGRRQVAADQRQAEKQLAAHDTQILPAPT